MATANEKDAIKRRDMALELARRYGQSEKGHQKAWVIDQMCRVLLGDEYEAWVADAKAGEDEPETYCWDTGISP